MKSIYFLLLSLAVFPVMASENCIVPKMDYTRKCADISNLNNLPTLENAGDCATLTIEAKSHWNASGLRLEKGRRYQIEINENDQWCDASVVTNYKGWDIVKGGEVPGSGACPQNKECGRCVNSKAVAGPDVDLGWFNNTLTKSTKWLRRAPDAELFTLIGITKGGHESGKPFEIQNLDEITVKSAAEFCAYANDLSLMYGNNSGQLTLKIKRLD